jgi:glycosyltransferase involved in cell wall biosynthesis
MERFCDEQQMGNVRIVGFVNQSAISGYYSIADIFVLCSGMGETWGLVVNEAMNFELPVVVTETCGCARDLVVDGENGFVCPEGDIAQLRGALRKLAADEVFRTRAGKRSAAQIEAYTVEQIVKNMAGFGWTK